MNIGTPCAEAHIDSELVEKLLLKQHPDLANRPISRLDSGWDNAMYRLGDDLVVRLPRRKVAASLILHEQCWLPEMSHRLPVLVPSPLRVGKPDCGYPWSWSIVPWIPGQAADLAPPRLDQGSVFGQFLKCLHQPAPAIAPENPLRGVPLKDRAGAVEERLARLKRETSAVNRRIEQDWERALLAAPSAENRWLHGDLHAQNVLVSQEQIAAVIDWGDITSGDVATDLAGVWTLFDDPAARNAALETYSPSQDTVWRAKGWAIFFGAVLLDTGRVNNPRHEQMGIAILRRLTSAA